MEDEGQEGGGTGNSLLIPEPPLSQGLGIHIPTSQPPNRMSNHHPSPGRLKEPPQQTDLLTPTWAPP